MNSSDCCRPTGWSGWPRPGARSTPSHRVPRSWVSLLCFCLASPTLMAPRKSGLGRCTRSCSTVCAAHPGVNPFLYRFRPRPRSDTPAPSSVWARECLDTARHHERVEWAAEGVRPHALGPFFGSGLTIPGRSDKKGPTLQASLPASTGSRARRDLVWHLVPGLHQPRRHPVLDSCQANGRPQQPNGLASRNPE